MAISYIVVPFAVGARGKLEPGAPSLFKRPDKAIASAKSAADREAGAFVIEQDAEPKNSVYGEPKLVAHFGRLPEGFVEHFA